MTADVSVTRHDRIGAIGDDVLLGRTTLDRVIPCEGRINIASFSSDRSGTNARRHAASEGEMHCELGSIAADSNRGHAAARIAGQGQIAYVD